MKKFIAIALFAATLVIPEFIYGQPFIDLFRVQKSWFNEAAYKNDPNASLTQSSSTVNLFVPIVFKNKNVLFIGYDYFENGFYYQSDTSYHKYLQQHLLELGFTKKWSGTPWVSTFMLLPRLSGDFNGIKSSELQPGGVVVMTYKKRNSLKFKFGIYYNREFYGNSFLPLLGIDWKINNRLYMFGVLPGSMNFEYKLSEKFYTGLAYRNSTITYRIKGEPEKYYILEGNSMLGNNTLYPFIHYYMAKNFVIYAGAGMSLFHYFQMYNADEKKITQTASNYRIFNEVRDGAFFQLGAAFRIRMDKDYND